MSYGFIERGPMAADQFEAHFTRIANQLFRDPRISFKAKGIFGLISTHKDGFGLSLESIAAASTDGVSAVRTGLQELERHRYLVRARERNEAGHLKQTRYWITDMPDGIVITLDPGAEPGTDAAGAPRSEPECENGILDDPADQVPGSGPECGFPQVDAPPVDDDPHKKTNIQKTISLPRPTRGGDGPPGPADERETPASPPTGRTGAEVAAAWAGARERLGRPVPPLAPARIAATAAGLLAQGLDAALLTAAAADMAGRDGWIDLARHLEHFTPRPASPAPVQASAAWCGQCNNGHPPGGPAERMRERPDGRVVRCPDCHPAAVSS
ncbi:hypothetical protein [Kitasatospora sp. NPDC056184]|uniref:hypothetical protein n=1 Tax=Kitasatospora sp. NPDC056184 TaxID=3345738 RepID=UPI0035DE6D2C